MKSRQTNRASPGSGALIRYCGVAAVLFALAALVWSIAGSPPRGPSPPGDAAGAPEGKPQSSDSDTSSAPNDPELTWNEATAGSLEEDDEADERRPSGPDALTDNPLYDTGRLAPRPCPAPEVDVDDPESMDTFLNVVADCLDEAWSTQFRRAGLPFEPPERVFWTESGTSPCRDYPSAAGAFYCRASASIYIGTSDVVRKWNEERNGVVYASLLAHEYGHHVQGESGILEYYHDQRRLEEGTPERNAWTRQSELQANCFAGVFLGAVFVSYPLSDTDRRVLMDDAEATADRVGEEDNRTHGTPENSLLWTETGLAEQQPGACNTWDAADELVE